MSILKLIGYFSFLIFIVSCKKDKEPDPAPQPVHPTGKFAYSDTVLYLKAADYTVSPTEARSGTYTAFPDDLNINSTTGAITVSPNGKSGLHSQAGLRYKIFYTSPAGQKDSTLILISGIHYQDRIYKMTDADAWITPIYNAGVANPVLPGSYSSDNNKLAIASSTGKINFKQSINNGLFGGSADNDDWKVVEISYNPNNGTRTHKMEVVIYYYDTIADIPSNVSTAMRAHQSQLIGLPEAPIPFTSAPPDNDINDIVSLFKPRPPCIIIVGH